MFQADVSLGHEETWTKLITVYPPIDVLTMQSALGMGYPGQPMFPTTREVRVNKAGEIEIWERRIRRLTPETMPYPVKSPDGGDQVRGMTGTR